LRCFDCKTWNTASANYCARCGAPLREGLPVKSRIGLGPSVSIMILITGIALGYFLHDYIARDKDKSIRGSAELAQKDDLGPDEAPPTTSRALFDDAYQRTPFTLRKDRLPVGWVLVENPWGRQISRVPAIVFGGGWVALPAKAQLGGNRLQFQIDEERTARVENGLWRDGDLVGLWNVEGGVNIATPDLAPWDSAQPVEWLSFGSDVSLQAMDLLPIRERGLLAECRLTAAVDGPGVFIQNGHVVGWTFEPWLDEGFMWIGPALEDLEYDITAENYYVITFANGREEQFGRALAMGDEVPPSERLKAFAEGFRLIPRLSAQDTPGYLRPDPIVHQMRSLVAAMLQEGLALEVTEILDDYVMMEAADPLLLSDVVAATTRAHGYEDGIRLTEDLGTYIARKRGQEFPQLDQRRSQLYEGWIRELLAAKDFQGARRTFDRAGEDFPDDPEIHLLGVELALAVSDWAEAERLLYVRDYPGSLTDRARVFAVRIAELKAEAGKIVIRFRPGASYIPVKATLNGRLEHDFVIDTGATMVTIPRGAIAALGIRIDANSPKREVSTAGGVRMAREVRLDSITLGGWVVRNVAALVVDIPDKPSLGLLGLNYLGNFRVELNNEKGVLLLRPR
jgi:clan AA aspartic protease (TIGR02281 family)